MRHYLARKNKMQTSSMKGMTCLMHLNSQVGFGRRLTLKAHDTLAGRLVVFRRCRPTSEMPVDTRVPRVFLADSSSAPSCWMRPSPPPA